MGFLETSCHKFCSLQWCTTTGCILLSTVAKDHRNLRANPCQISVVEPKCGKAYLHYVKDESKNKPGCLRGRQKARKEVIQHCNPERCPVRLFQLYQSMCPKQRPAYAFYLQPLKCLWKDCWYSAIPVGFNKLKLFPDAPSCFLEATQSGGTPATSLKHYAKYAQ